MTIIVVILLHLKTMKLLTTLIFTAIFIVGCGQNEDEISETFPTDNEVEEYIPFNAKKGFGKTTKNVEWNSKVEDLRVSWHYSWGHELKSDEPDSVEFVPMIWGAWSDTAKIQAKLDQVKEYKDAGLVHYLLGFNEPDGKEQANMTVKSALDYWPKLMEVGLPLGSPAAVHADKDWMQNFMSEVESRNYRVDFICVHWYGGSNAQGLVNHLNKVYELYKRPIWITEFAPADWNASSPSDSKITKEKAMSFMKEILPILDTMSIVERYAWFSAKTSSAPLGNSSLFYDSGNLTPLGKYYREFYEKEN